MTAAGEYLRATATNGRAAAQPGDGASEVFARAFELAVQLRFRADSPPAEIAWSIRRTALRHTTLAVPIREAEMLVRAALGESVPISDLQSPLTTAVHLLVFAAVVEELALTDQELEALIAEAEQITRTTRPGVP